MNRMCKVNVSIQEYIEKYISDYIEFIECENCEELEEHFENTEEQYFISGDWQTDEFLEENKLKTSDYIQMCEELINNGNEPNVCKMNECMNMYISNYINENSEDLFKYYLEQKNKE